MLDSSSGLRYSETIEAFTRHRGDPIARGLWDQFDRHGTTAARLEEIVDLLQNAPFRGMARDPRQPVCVISEELDHPNARKLLR